MNKKLKIVIAADPFANTLKEAIVKHLQENGYEITDVGENLDYYTSCPIACKMLQEKKADRAILLCGTGMGMSVIANRFPGVVASCVESVFAARMCRAINDANALCMGAMIWGNFMACEAVDVFLTTGFTETLPQFADYLKDAKAKVEAIRP
ncbi:MAG: RpiB/LacA/LacB family sugar-phosphate isomerase [Planctomycetaceae bacterium]|nr:RpiB/LacA/LacB family sugar-phosphate isomerase [Planctomycetaceae bacterium]